MERNACLGVNINNASIAISLFFAAGRDWTIVYSIAYVLMVRSKNVPLEKGEYMCENPLHAGSGSADYS